MYMYVYIVRLSIGVLSTHMAIFSVQVKLFVEGLFHLDKDIPQFKEHLRDFLVQIKVGCVCVCECVCVSVCVCVCVCVT